jgi:beta-N-acetylhexosaminidase
MAIAATGDVALAEEQGRVTAREAMLLGVDHILAPVCDVNSDPRNPVINTRSFGEDPHEVAKYVSAFVRGVQGEGALATAKHFPGHGDTHVDSHLTLPVVDADRERLERVELVPFRAAIDAGVASVMVGHLSLPAIDPAPATISRSVVDILRHDLGFGGLVVTDAMDMGGIAAQFDAGEASVRALEAGQDQIMFSPDTDAAIAAVREAVRSGRVSEARIDESVERIMSAKKGIRARPASQEEIFRTLDCADHRAMAEEIARRAVTLVRDERGLLPLREGNVTAVVVSDIPEVENPLADAVRDLGAKNVFTLDVRSTEDDIVAIDGDPIVLLLALRAKSYAGRIAVPRAARLLAERHARKTIAVSFGSPYLIRELPGVGTYVCAYGIQPVMQRAAVRVLRGAEAPGRLPVSL